MKKTLTANISGTVFHIEEDAYAKLQRYLDTVRAQFSGSDGRDEIMADIECAAIMDRVCHQPCQHRCNRAEGDESVGTNAVVRFLAAQGTAVLFVSHDLAEVLALSERVTALRNGRVPQMGAITTPAGAATGTRSPSATVRAPCHSSACPTPC